MLMNNGRMGPKGELGVEHLKAKEAMFDWKLRNSLRWSFITGWLGKHIVMPFAQHTGMLAAMGELSIVHFRWQNQEEVTAWQELCGKRDVALLAGDFDLAEALGVAIAQLEARRIRTDYGVVSRKSVTTAFVTFVVDQLQTESSLFGDFKFHDSGVGTTAENITDTAMETTDGESRVTGTQTESAANAYRSVGTIAYTTTKAITEHGLFNDVTAGTLMDRSVFSAVNVVNLDSVQYTYTLTLTAGG